MGKVSYSAVVLDERSRERLLRKFEELIPKDWEILAHHMTINMGELNPEFERYLSMPVKLEAIDFAMDDKVAAIGVKGFHSQNAKPHITLAVNRNNGGKPVMSNKLTDWELLKRPYSISGKVEEIPFNF